MTAELLEVPWEDRPLWESVVTVNDDWTTPLRSNVPYLARLRPMAIVTQESKTHHYRTMMGPNWSVRQDLESQATAGVAVLINTRRAEPFGPARRQKADVTGWGFEVLAERDRGDDMLDRGIAWQDAFVDGDRRRPVRVGGAHRPPKREADDWAEFDRNFRAWCERSPIPVLVGLDANQEHPRGLLRPGFTWTGAGIDGFVHSISLTVNRRELVELPKRTSDHHPILAGVRIPRMSR